MQGFIYFHNMKYIFSALLSIITLQSYAQKNELAQAIKQQAHPLTTTSPLQPMDDLAFLKEVTQNKTVIGLGEATHGTKDFFTMKHRLLKYFVEERGYRIFAIEASMPECVAINDYVMYGKGDPAEALFGIYFWTWNTNEVLDMIRWMRSYNEGKPDDEKVKFYGFDMQHTIVAAKNVMEDLDKVKIKYDRYKPLLDSLSQQSSRKYYKKGKDTLLNLCRQLEELSQYTDRYKADFIERASIKDYEQHYQNLTILSQALISKTFKRDSYRDSCMALNIKWISEQEQTDKIIVWAHNGHVAKAKIFKTKDGYQMGYWLKQLFSNKYYAINFDFREGSFRAMQRLPNMNKKLMKKLPEGVVNCHIHKKTNHSTDYIFHETDLPLFYLDYKTASTDTLVAQFLSTQIKLKYIGAAFIPKYELKYYFDVVLKDYYDATIFINTTTAAIPTEYYTEKIKEYYAKKKE